MMYCMTVPNRVKSGDYIIRIKQPKIKGDVYKMKLAFQKGSLPEKGNYQLKPFHSCEVRLLRTAWESSNLLFFINFN